MIKLWGLRRKKQSRNNRRENSLAAITVICVEQSHAQKPACTNTHTHSHAGIQILWDQAIRTRHVCTHVHMHTLTGVCDPWDPATGSMSVWAQRVQTQLCAHHSPTWLQPHRALPQVDSMYWGQ